jgi:hypothetical protein
VNGQRLAEAYNPAWLKVLSYAGIPALTAIAVWLITRLLWEEGITAFQYIIGFAIGAAMLYQCAIGWLVLRHIDTRIIAFDDRLQVQTNGTERTLLWEQLAPPKDYAFATATRLSLKSGETLIYAFDRMTDLHIIKHVLSDEHHEGRAEGA